MEHTDLKVGVVVVFTAVPSSSYLSVDVPYVVAWASKSDVYFRRVTGDSGTSERRFVIAGCEFEPEVPDGNKRLMEVIEPTRMTGHTVHDAVAEMVEETGCSWSESLAWHNID